MRATEVLLIESARLNGVSFADPLARKYELRVAHSGKQGITMALERRPDVVVLDAISMRTSGDRICKHLRDSLGELPIIHIRPLDAKESGESAADIVLYPRFTARKLSNRIDRFKPAPEGQKLEVGAFQLNPDQQTLNTPSGEHKLTPKLVALMNMFMMNPNATLERKDIMKAVWNTDYMGDTRTLDVHIRWLRKVVEPTPRKPDYITTIRGVGYRFVPEGSSSLPEKAAKPSPKSHPVDASAERAKKLTPDATVDVVRS